MPRVFIPQNSTRFDLSGACRYGELTVMSQDRLDPFDPNETADSLYDALVLNQFSADDFLCMTGNTLILPIFVATALTLQERVKLLMFDARIGDYVLRVFERPNYA